MAIPYPSEIFRPYVFEPIGEFLSYWGPEVFFPLAHWAAWIAILLSSVMIFRKLWWEMSTGGPMNRHAEAVRRQYEIQERQKLLRERSGGISE